MEYFLLGNTDSGSYHVFHYEKYEDAKEGFDSLKVWYCYLRLLRSVNSRVVDEVEFYER